MEPCGYLQDQHIRAIRSHAVGDISRRSAQRVPNKLAIIDGDTQLTFRELDALTDRAAAALYASGFQPGDRVALFARNCWQYVVLVLATARAGVVLVPLNFMLGSDEIRYILEHSGTKGIVAECGLGDVAQAALSELPSVRTRIALPLDGDETLTGWTLFEDWLAAAPASAPMPVIDDDRPLRLMYTSGTESRPKGAMLSSRSLMWQYVSTIVSGSMAGDDIEVHALPLFHCAQLDAFLMPDVYLGATSVILRRADPAAILRAVQRHRATKLFAPPTVWIGLLRSPDFASTDLSTLRKGYYGASPMPAEILKEIAEKLPCVSLWNLYGQTEISPLATVLAPHEQHEYAGSAGRPALNVETAILDDAGRPAGVGEVGEIVHRSPQLMLGYFNDAERTAEAFANGWFHSGDLGFFDERGLLYVVDRKKDMIKSGGENVASREVEETLYEHAGVHEVAVFGVPDAKWVEAVTAAVVRRDHTLTGRELLAHCRARLAAFKVPKHVVFVDELPKNPSGKILKRELRARYITDATPG